MMQFAKAISNKSNSNNMSKIYQLYMYHISSISHIFKQIFDTLSNQQQLEKLQ